jgi:hypothetical protein
MFNPDKRETELYMFIKKIIDLYYLSFEDLVFNFQNVNSFLLKKEDVYIKTLKELYTEECKKYNSIKELILRSETKFKVIYDNTKKIRQHMYDACNQYEIADLIDSQTFVDCMQEMYLKDPKKYNYHNYKELFNITCEEILNVI